MSTETSTVGRLMMLLGAVALGIGLVGFLIGISQPVVPKRASERSPVETVESLVTAPNYREVDSSAIGPNQDWTSDFSAFQQARPDLYEPVVRTSAMKDEALRDRLRTRAFDGAPPIVPHIIEQQSAASCLACHRDGMRLGDRIATRISHPHFASCTQCHVEAASSSPIVEKLNSDERLNEFAGLLRTGPGTRAMTGAPPTIPHSTHLRGDCMSCHGLVARPGLRTTHPWLQNCVQCHAAASELSQLSPP